MNKIMILIISVLVFFIAYSAFFMYRGAKLFGAKKPVRIALMPFPFIISAVGLYFGNTLLLLVFLHVVILDVIITLILLVLRKKPKKFTAFISVILSLAILTFGYFNMKNIVKTEYFIKSDKANVKLAFLSDAHIGNALSPKDIVEIVDKINAENVDFVLLGGDIFDNGTTKEQMSLTLEALNKLNSKTYYVIGNHDLHNRDLSDENELISMIKSHNINVLIDEVATVGNVKILGRSESFYGNRKSIKELSESLGDGFIINLDHQPKEIKEASKYCDLMLSGHTHGGQIFPVGIFCETMGINELNYGERKIVDFTAITSSGISGWGFPIRTEGKSEYLIIKIGEKS